MVACQGSKVGRKVQVGSRAQPRLSYIFGKKSVVVTAPHEVAEGIEGIEKKQSLVSSTTDNLSSATHCLCDLWKDTARILGSQRGQWDQQVAGLLGWRRSLGETVAYVSCLT